MKKGYLSEYFEGVAVKTLSKVDADCSSSNQHEIGTTKAMREFLEEEHQKKFHTTYLWFGGEQEGFSVDDYSTHYDTRIGKEDRPPEWRLYYRNNPVTDCMNQGDTLFLAKRRNDHLLFVVAPAGSSIESQLLWLFGYSNQPELKFSARSYSADEGAEIDFTARFLLDELGIEFEDPNANSIDTIIDRFGFQFPKTREFSDLARLTLPEVDVSEDPDLAIIAWLDHEEAMFRRLERRIVSARIEEGFVDQGEVDVDGFLSFSLSVQNRRKSRMGLSFEHHLAAVFDAWSIEYTKGAKTERNNTPDFLFPGETAYFQDDFPNDHLSMLGAKSVCKERWRQILPEADRIEAKHLVTLEPAISAAQTDQMAAHLVQLVVPNSIQSSYTVEQRNWLWSLRDFVDHVKRLERLP
ncbi:EcoRII C terminal [Parasphingorhabdus marina DSM 22363]|uniref:EcoRII C terminal n=1 Tax=Parasphingorhabdus marina DSM 22363 TaxID=1123272 RepID=A0A1N6CMX6_9SPHN|nr:type II restriction endonuclease [Parasphingorhabdus marina]SIN59903.1 EcoRII C terminal [Parasphingorhabdus marina DSM 22363]